MTSPKNLIGRRIREARESKGLLPSELSQLCARENQDLTAEEVLGIENQTREVSDFELLALSKVLEVSGTKLLFGDEPFPEEEY